MHVRARVCVYMCVDTNKGWEQESDSMELELEMAMSCLTWVLGTKLESSEVAANTLTWEPSLQRHNTFSAQRLGA